MKNKYALIGAGGHSRIVYEIICYNDISIACIVVPDKCKSVPDYYSNYKVLSDSELLTIFKPDNIKLVLGIGKLPGDDTRKNIYLKYKQSGYQFSKIIHPSTILSKNVVLSEGCQIMAGTVLQPGATIGENTIINTNSSIDHDVNIGNHCHIAPGVTICGGVCISDNVFIGAGATIVNNVKVKANSIIKAGTIVTCNV